MTLIQKNMDAKQRNENVSICYLFGNSGMFLRLALVTFFNFVTDLLHLHKVKGILFSLQYVCVFVCVCVCVCVCLLSRYWANINLIHFDEEKQTHLRGLEMSKSLTKLHQD